MSPKANHPFGCRETDGLAQGSNETPATQRVSLESDTVSCSGRQLVLMRQRSTRAEVPATSFSTSASVTIVVSPGVVMASAP